MRIPGGLKLRGALSMALKRTPMRPLTLDSLNPQLLKVEYAVRGELAIKAEDLRNKLEMGYTLPFKRVINSNIGNPQQKGLDQPPITFSRQVSPRALRARIESLGVVCHRLMHTARLIRVIRRDDRRGRRCTSTPGRPAHMPSRRARVCMSWT